MLCIFHQAWTFHLLGCGHRPSNQTLLCLYDTSLPVHTLLGTSPSKGTDGDRLMRSTTVLITSTQKDLGNFEWDSIHLIHSQIFLFILSTTPLCWGVLATLFSSLIPCSQQYCSNCPRYSTPLSARIQLSFLDVKGVFWNVWFSKGRV